MLVVHKLHTRLQIIILEKSRKGPLRFVFFWYSHIVVVGDADPLLKESKVLRNSF